MPFRKGEILTVISKDEEQWWTAMNSLGQTGSIPVPYVQKVIINLFIFSLPYELAAIESLKQILLVGNSLRSIRRDILNVSCIIFKYR